MNVDEWLDICEANGIKLIPAVEGEKIPLVNWKDYEEIGPTKEQIRQWQKQYPNCNWAILCGKPSGNLTVLDFDNPENFAKTFPKKEEICQYTWVVKSPHGWHVYLRQPDTEKSFKIPDYVECRSTGNIVIAPPSKLKDKQTGATLEYKFESRPPDINGIADLPNALYKHANELGYKTTQPQLTESSEWVTTTFNNPWIGNEPPCITQLIQLPAKKGERDETAMRIAAYYANFCFNIEKARDKMTSWHAKIEQSTDPYSLQQALSKINHVRNNKYIYGCNDPYLQRHCHDGCQFKIGKQAKTLLANAEILNEIKKLLDILIAGEESNKLLLFLLCLSGKCKDPKKKQIILVQGEPGGGKTHLTKTITKMYKTKTVGRFSEHALDYTDLSGYEILYLQELGNMDDEKNGVSTLKFLSADDQGYRIEVTIRDPDTNQFTTQERIIPPITVITTTNRVEIDPQLERRAWPLAIDESKDQTHRIKEYKVHSVNEDNLILLGLQQKKKSEDALTLLQKIINELSDCDVILPFSDALFSIFKEDGHGHIRIRGDYGKISDLTWLLCFLLQKQLTKVNEKDGKPILFASPKATADMLAIIEKPMLKMVGKISAHEEIILNAMEKCGVTEVNDELDTNKRQQIASEIDLSPETVYKRLKELTRTNLIVMQKGKEKGSPVRFILKASLADIKRNIAEIVGILKTPTVLASNFINEAETWVNSVLASLDFQSGGMPKTLILENLKMLLLNEKNSLKTELNAEITPKPETPTVTPLDGNKPLNKVETPKQTIDCRRTGNADSHEGIFSDIPLDNVAYCVILEKEDYQLNKPCLKCNKITDLIYNVCFYNGKRGDICLSCGSRILEHLQRSQEQQP